MEILPCFSPVVLLRNKLFCESDYVTESDVRLGLNGRFESVYHVHYTPVIVSAKGFFLLRLKFAMAHSLVVLA